MAEEQQTTESTNEEVVEEQPIESTEQETEPTQEQELDTVEAEEAQEEAEIEEVEEAPEAPQPEEKPPSRRESLRIQQLLEKMKQPPQQPEYQGQAGLDYNEYLNADPEVLEQLEADRQGYGNQAYTQGVKQAESIQFHTRLEIDAPKVESKYPQLNKEAPEFNPAVADAVNSWYLATAGYDPQTNSVSNSNVRYAEFVDGIMELANEMAGEKVATTSKNIAKQAASTGLRPDGSSAKRLDLSKAPEDMTNEELNAFIKSNLKSK